MTSDALLVAFTLTVLGLVVYGIRKIQQSIEAIDLEEHAPLVWVGHRTATVSCECGEFVQVFTRPANDKDIQPRAELLWRMSPCFTQTNTEDDHT